MGLAWGTATGDEDQGQSWGWAERVFVAPPPAQFYGCFSVWFVVQKGPLVIARPSREAETLHSPPHPAFS